MRQVTNRFFFGVLAGLTAAGSVRAADKKPAQMKCEDFIALDEVTRPKAVYWAEGFTKKGKPEDMIIDFDETDRLVPILVEDCTKAPKVSFLDKVKAKVKKIF